MADRARTILGTAALLVAGLAFLAGPSSAYTRIDPSSPDYQIGDLAWNSGSGTIAWKRGSASADVFDPYEGLTEPVPIVNTAGTSAEASFWTTGGTPSATRVVEFVSAPLTADLAVNGSRLVQVKIFATGTQRWENGACTSGYEMDIRLFLDDKFVGGGRGASRYDFEMDGVNYVGFGRYESIGYSAAVNTPMDLCQMLWGIQSEEPLWPAGSVLKVQFILRATDGGQWKMQGGFRSHVAIPVFSEFEQVFRLQDVPEADAQASEEPAVSGLASLAALPLLALGGLRRRRLFAVLLVLALLTAGCAGRNDASEEKADGLQREEVEQTVVPGAANGPNGSILGVVIDEFRRPVVAAHVSVLNYPAFAVTDGQGRFSLGDVAPGSYRLRVDRAGFRSFETQNMIKVEPGGSTFIEIALALLVRGEGGTAPHDHNYWSGPSKVLMDRVEVARIKQSERVNFAITPPSSPTEYNSVLPGTYLMEVTLEWDADFDLGLDFRTAADRNSGPAAENRTYMFTRASGEKHRIAVGWEMTDPGHQHFSSWVFGIVPKNYGWTVRTANSAVLTPVYATIEIFRGGRLPIEAPHVDRWGDNLSLALGERTVSAPFCNSYYVMCTSKAGDPLVNDYMNVSWAPSLVPVGTEWVEVVATPKGAYLSDPIMYKLAYKGASSPPNGCKVNQPQSIIPVKDAQLVSGSATSKQWRWKIVLASDDADPFYARDSAWCLFIYREEATFAGYWGTYAEACTRACGEQSVLLVNATAHRSSVQPVVNMG